MAVRIRLSRVGRKNRPVFRLVAMDSRVKRDGKFLEHLGTFDPIRHEFSKFNSQGIEKWISVGAQCSDSVKKIIKMYKKTSSVQQANIAN